MGGSITEVGGILVGHAHDAVRGSGVTALLFLEGAMAVADIRGEAAGTRQMDSLLRPHPVRKIHALVFAGGSAFGLDAASGVVRYLEERNIGFPTPGGIVPIVPTAVVYDLGYGDGAFRPDSVMGYEAACAAAYARDYYTSAPALFEVFPPNATAGWYAVASFSSGTLVVSLFSNTSVYMGQTVYTGADETAFGFYLRGPGGLFFSGDARNGGNPQVLTYAGTGIKISCNVVHNRIVSKLTE